MISQEQAKIMAKRWKTIYPAYLDNSKSIEEGTSNNPYIKFPLN
jgi:hypothetical protein